MKTPKNLNNNDCFVKANAEIYDNKYVRCLLLSYYMLTRSLDLFQAVIDSKVTGFYKELYHEYMKYMSNDYVTSNEEDEQASNMIIPKTNIVKSSNVLSACDVSTSDDEKSTLTKMKNSSKKLSTTSPEILEG